MSYDVAISFASEDQWIANDLYTLLTNQGVSVYFSDRLPDVTARFLRKELFSIYRQSTLNVLLWSSSYATKRKDSPIHMEKNVLFDRHIGGNEHSSLLIVNVDSYEAPNEFSFCPAHPLKDFGISGIKEFVIDRLIASWRFKDEFGITYNHPPTKNRSKQMEPFTFKINTGFESKTRWKTLGDIEVVSADKIKRIDKLKIFLIPSGSKNVPIFLSHSTFLKSREDLLLTKQKTGLEFARQNAEKQLLGVLFYIDKDISYPHVYCHDYDKFLSANWKNFHN